MIGGRMVCRQRLVVHRHRDLSRRIWWVAYVVPTIAGERLELNRVMRPTALVPVAFVIVLAALVAVAVEDQ